MQPYPHTYTVAASGEPTGLVAVESPRLEMLSTAPPAEFGGPGNRWSPETLLVGSIADCFVLTFRAVTRAARCSWLQLDCRVEGILEHIDGRARFSRYTTRAALTLAEGADEATARKLLEKAEHGCLIANSLCGTRTLEIEIKRRENAAA